MPPKQKITKEEILTKAFEMIQENGIETLNARSLARKLECSTQPLFRQFVNMDDLRAQVKIKIDAYYKEFIQTYLVKEDDLLTMSCAYIEFARKERHFFGALFVYPLIQKRSIEEVVNSDWNLQSILCCQKQYNLTKEGAEQLYRDVRFYSHGIATQLYAEMIILKEGEVEKLVRNAIGRFK